MTFKDPWILALIVLACLLIFWNDRFQESPSLRFSSAILWQGIPPGWKVKSRYFLWLLRLLALIFFIVALARPQQSLKETVHKMEGIDIVLAIDCSGSMAAEDFTIHGQRVNRLVVVKSVVRDFVAARPHDRLALVAFAGLAYTVCPLTTDYDWLLTNLERIELGVLEDGTAVGSAISSSLNRLKQSQAKSKVVILLTDGMNNAGRMDPKTAAKIAKTMNVKVYTIGAGSRGLVPFPVEDVWGRKIYQNVALDLDEETLQEIARITYAQYFRATDTPSLKQIYQEIDALEKTEIQETGYKEYQELFGSFLMVGLICLVSEVILSRTLFLRIP